jgi:tRNA (mo5U34)-methyltransferase
MDTTSPTRSPVTQEQVDQFKWWHSIDFGNGTVSKGAKTLDMLKAEFDIVFRHGVDGRRIIDIGAWDGAFSFEAMNRGATDVLATDGFIWANKAPWVSTKEPFDFANAALGGRVRSLTADIYNMDSGVTRPAHVVLFLGVLYHLKHPLWALERVAEMTRDYAVIETETRFNTADAPIMQFFPHREMNGDRSNWCAPNVQCVVAWLETVGFRAVECAPSPYNTGGADSGRFIFHAWK